MSKVMDAWETASTDRAWETEFLVPAAVAKNASAQLRLSQVQNTLMTGGGKIGQGYLGVLVERQPDDPELSPLVDVFSNSYLFPFPKDGEPEKTISKMPTGGLLEVDNAPTIEEVLELGRVAVEGSEIMVRRLTPVECERIMGWPEDHTRWTDTGEEVKQSQRYKMCGNGVASPVAEWVGRKVMEAHNATSAR